MLYPSRTYGITAMSPRDILAANLTALMASSSSLNTLVAVEKATEAIGMKVGKSTVDRLRNGTTPVNLDYIDALAQAFGLDAWQLLVPGIDPRNPPTLRSISPAEEQMYSRMRELASQISRLEAKP